MRTKLPHCDIVNEPMMLQSVDIQTAQLDYGVTKRITCPICKSPCMPLHQHNLTHCHTCEHIFQTDLRITVSYDADYAHKYDKFPHQAMSTLRWNFIQSTLKLPVASKILDVGYANGAFLKHALGAGMSIHGIDLHTEDFGIPVVNFDTPIDYDLVSFFDSLEHFSDFADVAKLRTKYIIVSLPLTPGFMPETPHIWRHYRPGEHIHYFSPQSLSSFMARLGFCEQLQQGFPEDALRGKLFIGGRTYDNIYTAIFARS